jgi:hypothetical protein
MFNYNVLIQKPFQDQLFLEIYNTVPKIPIKFPIILNAAYEYTVKKRDSIQNVSCNVPLDRIKIQKFLKSVVMLDIISM